MKSSHSLGRQKLLLLFSNSIRNEMILNFDQTPLGFTAPNKTTFVEKGAQSVRIGNIDDKYQMTDNFCVSISCEFLLIQRIYFDVTYRCHPKMKLPRLIPYYVQFK